MIHGVTVVLRRVFDLMTKIVNPEAGMSIGLLHIGVDPHHVGGRRLADGARGDPYYFGS